MLKRLNNARQGAYFRSFPLRAVDLDSWIEFAEIFGKSQAEIQDIIEDFRKAYEEYTDWLTGLIYKPL